MADLPVANHALFFGYYLDWTYAGNLRYQVISRVNTILIWDYYMGGNLAALDASFADAAASGKDIIFGPNAPPATTTITPEILAGLNIAAAYWSSVTSVYFDELSMSKTDMENFIDAFNTEVTNRGLTPVPIQINFTYNQITMGDGWQADNIDQVGLEAYVPSSEQDNDVLAFLNDRLDDLIAATTGYDIFYVVQGYLNSGWRDDNIEQLRLIQTTAYKRAYNDSNAFGLLVFCWDRNVTGSSALPECIRREHVRTYAAINGTFQHESLSCTPSAVDPCAPVVINALPFVDAAPLTVAEAAASQRWYRFTPTERLLLHWVNADPSQLPDAGPPALTPRQHGTGVYVGACDDLALLVDPKEWSGGYRRSILILQADITYQFLADVSGFTQGQVPPVSATKVVGGTDTVVIAGDHSIWVADGQFVRLRRYTYPTLSPNYEEGDDSAGIPIAGICMAAVATFPVPPPAVWVAHTTGLVRRVDIATGVTGAPFTGADSFAAGDDGGTRPLAVFQDGSGDLLLAYPDNPGTSFKRVTTTGVLVAQYTVPDANLYTTDLTGERSCWALGADDTTLYYLTRGDDDFPTKTVAAWDLATDTALPFTWSAGVSDTEVRWIEALPTGEFFGQLLIGTGLISRVDGLTANTLQTYPLAKAPSDTQGLIASLAVDGCSAYVNTQGQVPS